MAKAKSGKDALVSLTLAVVGGISLIAGRQYQNNALDTDPEYIRLFKV